MSMSDPIAAMLTIIRNGQMSNKTFVCTPFSKIKMSILSVLKDEGYILDYEQKEIENNKKRLKIKLKYFQGQPDISKLKRISKPSLRKYSGASEINSVKGGLGSYILSTNQGLMTDKDARANNVGGEILCEVF